MTLEFFFRKVYQMNVYPKRKKLLIKKKLFFNCIRMIFIILWVFLKMLLMQVFLFVNGYKINLICGRYTIARQKKRFSVFSRMFSVQI